MKENKLSASTEFERVRPTLLGIAYRMLGSFTEAEDIVQEAYLRFQEAEKSTIESSEAYLRTIVVRLCLDDLKSSRSKREMYAGIWLPEPINTDAHSVSTDDPAEQVSLQESLSTAFLLLLEALTPDERAVFLLRTVFEYEYDEISHILSKSEAACRKLLSRAKKHVAEHRPILTSSLEEHREILGEFLAAVQGGDIDALMSLLADNVIVYGDGGGKVPSAPHPVTGREQVVKLFIGLAHLVQPTQSIEIIPINGREGIIVRERNGAVSDAISFEIGNSQVQAVFVVLNPDKLHHLSTTSQHDL